MAAKQIQYPNSNNSQAENCAASYSNRSIATEAETNASRTHPSRSFSAKRHNVHTLRYP